MLESCTRRRGAQQRKILIVDDDVRNVSPSPVCSNRTHGGALRRERNDGIELLHRNPEVDLVLDDIMMPGMDGYETMRTIRSENRSSRSRSSPSRRRR